jgi:preprotein translocase subunit SecD
MSSGWKFRFGMALAITIVSILALIPSLFVKDTEAPEWAKWLSEEVSARITPGLDLQGGLHLQYQVDIDKAISDKLDRYADQLRRSAKKAHPGSPLKVARIDGKAALEASAEGADVNTLLDTDELALLHLTKLADGAKVKLSLDAAYVEQTRSYALNQAIETIRKRIDALGVAEPTISRRGDADIIVQLPGLSEAQFKSTKDLIGQTAQLEFRMVADEDNSFFAGAQVAETEGVTNAGGRPASADLQKLKAAVAALTPPEGTVIRFIKDEEFNRATQKMELKRYRAMLLKAEVPLTGEYITDARVVPDPQTNQPFVSLTLDGQGAKLFGDLTAANVGKNMAIVLDEVIASAPRINDRIPGGRVSITMGGGANFQAIAGEAQDLAIVLRNGALPAPIEKQFETQVGPSLGAESIKAGSLALVISLLLVGAYMIWLYRVSGVLATGIVMLIVLFILATMAALHATLTLPGIAGITLTIGQAVDANVLIYERIKEELAAGKSIQASVTAGFDRAMSAIIDGNVTTAIAGVVMLQYGSGPIKGFAVTLLIGIAATLYAAVSISKLYFEYLIERRRVTSLSI